MEIKFTSDSWEEYLWWQQHDKKTLKRLNKLIEDSIRNKYSGLGKPEPLKENFAGYWSRRIDQENRLVYRIKEGNLEIIQCKGHY